MSFFFFQAEDGIRDYKVTGFRRVLFRSPVLDIYPFASTSPIYVTVGREPVRSTEDAAFFVRWIDRLMVAAGAHTGWNTPQERDAVLKQFADARGVYARLATDAR